MANTSVENPLFDFDWSVDQFGYEIETEIPDPLKRITLLGSTEREVIKRRNGPPRKYRPLSEFPGLAREFSVVPEKEYLNFANRYGFLGMGLMSTPDGPEDIRIWRDRQKAILNILTARDAGKAKVANQLYNNTNHFMRSFVATQGLKKPRLVVQPHTLFDAMMLQVADELTTGINFKRCDNCTTWFKFRPNKNFCSSKCRYAHSNKKNKL